jgi:hypothetical protein
MNPRVVGHPLWCGVAEEAQDSVLAAVARKIPMKQHRAWAQLNLGIGLASLR